MITELIVFELKKGIAKNQVVNQANKMVNDFHKKQDGYVDMELICDPSEDQWKMIIHYETMEDIEKVKLNIPNSKAIKDFTALVLPESLKVSFYDQLQKWTSKN